jgi:HD-GYP domain-containing protein (c-di-GMP phosphodiesterase class II)
VGGRSPTRQGIPLGARIVAVCDAFHAMTSPRPYRSQLSPAAALEELRRFAGSQFDPRVVEALCSVLDASPAGKTADLAVLTTEV